MSTFLTSYIENNEANIEDVLLDNEILSELKFDSGKLTEFVIKNIDKIIDFVIVEPDINSSSKRIFSLPYKASEVLSGYNVTISKFIIKDKEIFFEKFLKYLKISSKNTIINSMLPTYCFKIINKIFAKNINIITEIILEDSKNEFKNIIFDCYKESLYLESSTTSIIMLLSCLYENEKHNAKYEVYTFIKKTFSNSLNQIVELLSNDNIEYIKHNIDNYNNESYIELICKFDIVCNIANLLMKLFKILNIIESNEDVLKNLINEIISEYNLTLIAKIINIISNNIKELISVVEIKMTIDTVSLLITNMLTNLIDINLFNSQNLSEFLTLFLYDEIQELSLISENKSLDENNNIYMNNLTLSKETAYNTINLIYNITIDSFVNLNKYVKDTNDSKKIPTNCNKLDYINIYSNFRLIYLDLIIIALLTINQNDLKQKKFYNFISIQELTNVIKDVSYFHSNSLFLNKCCKIFNILLFDKSKYTYLLDNMFNDNVFVNEIIYLSNMFVNSSFINSDKHTFSNSNYYSLNSAQVFNILDYFLSNLDKIKEKNINFYDNLLLNKQYILLYKEISKLELSNEKQDKSDLPCNTELDLNIKANNEEKSNLIIFIYIYILNIKFSCVCT